MNMTLDEARAIAERVQQNDVISEHAKALRVLLDALAERERNEPDTFRAFVGDIAKQTPEKPDYWSSCGQCEKNSHRAEDLLEAKPIAPAQHIPEGWKLVPVEATEEMCNAGWQAIEIQGGVTDSVWRDMLAATPQAPAAPTAPAQTQEPVAWNEGYPPHPYDKEWFIAETTFGDRVVLMALPKEHSYDLKTADETYMKKESVSRWMQFPDSEYVPYAKPTAPAQPLHPDDIAVDNFAKVMKFKLEKSRAKGRSGWDDPAQCSVEHLAKLLIEHVRKGDPTDVANLAMMLQQRGAHLHVLALAMQEEYPAQAPVSDGQRPDAIARSKKILALVDVYCDRPGWANRTALRCALFDEFNALLQEGGKQ